jgi:hypothetical protein
MSKIDTSVAWGPRVLGREKLDGRRWAYVVEAPFDMSPADLESLVGMRISADGSHVTIRGLVRCVPQRDVLAGDPIELLVVGG